jgi:ATP-dependent Clp protease ATP-binding subunit ClpA
MFERYTEKARRTIFFARYEASQYGSRYIESEHLLLGLLREDEELANRFLRSRANIESIRKQIEARITVREKVPTSVDLPLSHECKRVLAFAAEESEGLGHKHIGTAHLLLGLLRARECAAAQMLESRGVSLDSVRGQLATGAPLSAHEGNFIHLGVPGGPTKALVDEALLGFLSTKLSPEAQRILAYAGFEAQRLDRAQIGPAHLLLGILMEKGSAADKFLRANGVDAALVRASLFGERPDSRGHPAES